MGGGGEGRRRGAKHPASRKEREVVGEEEHIMVAEKDTVCGIH